jgi:hypothetical protein
VKGRAATIEINQATAYKATSVSKSIQGKVNEQSINKQLEINDSPALKNHIWLVIKLLAVYVQA